MIKKIYAAYFTGTGTTKRVVSYLADNISEKLHIPIEHYDFSIKKNRDVPMMFEENSLVIIGTPTIAGRVPNVLLKYLATMEGFNAYAVPIVLFGNRNYDNSLIELRDICIKSGMKVIGAGAFVGEHSFSYELGKGRPDEKDLNAIKDFAEKLADKLIKTNISDKYSDEILYVKGEPAPGYGGYYQPRDRKGNPVDIRKVVPKTDMNKCTDCKICADICPMGSIDREDVSKMTGICIKCCACIKRCPESAKYFDDEKYLYHKKELELGYTRRAEPEIFL